MKPLLLGLLTVSTLLSGSVQPNYQKVPTLYNHHFSVDQAYDYAFQNDPFFFPTPDAAQTIGALHMIPESLEIKNGQYKRGEQGAYIAHAEYNFVARDSTLTYSEKTPTIIVSDNLKDTNDKQVNVNFTNTACSNMPYVSDKDISPAISHNKIT